MCARAIRRCCTKGQCSFTALSTNVPSCRGGANCHRGRHEWDDKKIGSDSGRSPERNLDVNPHREEEMARLTPVSGFVLAFAGTVGLWATHAAANDELLK